VFDDLFREIVLTKNKNYDRKGEFFKKKNYDKKGEF